MQKNKSEQVNKNKRPAIPVDPELHRLLKVKAATDKRSIRSLTEEGIVIVLGEDNAN